MNYDELCEFDVLYKAYLQARKNKRKKAATAQYEANALLCTEKLSHILKTRKYRPSRFETFYVYEPKRRLVQAPAFVDKVTLHAIVDNVLYDAITKSFIRDNYASQLGKGTHDGLMRLKQHMVSYYRKNGSADGWVLKGDVRHFFASIDHDLLKKKLKEVCIKRDVDPKIYDLMCVYIDTTEGLPLGYQTSQLLALLFLDGFDHYVLEHIKPEGYGRYMDDFYLIFHTKREAQEALVSIRAYMDSERLELNEKTAIFPLRNGIDFIGFHSYITESGAVIQKLRREGVNRIRSKVRYWRKAYADGSISKEKIIECFRAWDAWAAHGDTYSLRSKYAGMVSEIVGEEVKPRRKISATKYVTYMRRVKQMSRMAKKRREEPTVTTRCYMLSDQT